MNSYCYHYMSHRTEKYIKSTSIFRKVFQNKGSINVNISLSIAKLANVKSQDYLVCEYSYTVNKIIFKLETKFPLLVRLYNEGEK